MCSLYIIYQKKSWCHLCCAFLVEGVIARCQKWIPFPGCSSIIKAWPQLKLKKHWIKCIIPECGQIKANRASNPASIWTAVLCHKLKVNNGIVGLGPILFFCQRKKKLKCCWRGRRRHSPYKRFLHLDGFFHLIYNSNAFKSTTFKLLLLFGFK